jgi:hypothetical protein
MIHTPILFCKPDMVQWSYIGVVLSLFGGIVGDENELVSIADAAAECGVSVEVFLSWLIDSGLVLRCPDGSYLPAPHPDIQII